jgi:hypothetical protein
MVMIKRPSERWRHETRRQATAVVAGTLAPADAYAAKLWPRDFITAVDTALDAYEAAVRELPEPSDGPSSSDAEVLAAVEHVVVALNAINNEHGRIETGEREELCEYIDGVLTAADIDTGALTTRRGIDRAALTDSWRDW